MGAGRASRKVYRAWTEPELVTQWFTPAPWTTPEAELDVRAGGNNRIKMRGPHGEDVDNFGVYLEVVPNEKLVFTDAYKRAWEPAEKPLMTVILTFEEAWDGKTKYMARVRHWTKEDYEIHEKMGFHAGWGKATEQLEALARTL